MTGPTAGQTWRSSLIVGIGVFLMSAAWAFSMPIGAGPDEPAHVIKAASVVRGEFVGQATSQPAVTRVSVPRSLAVASAWPCFAYAPEVSASCQSDFGADAKMVDAETSAGMYNPIYYLIVGVPSLIDLDPTFVVWGMRLLTGLVAAALIAGTFAVLSRIMSRLASIALLVSLLTPMVIFLTAIVNPNAWEILGGLGFLAGMLWFSVSPVVSGRAGKMPAILVGAGGFLAANARGVSPFWMLVLGLIFLIATQGSRVRELLRNAAFLTGLGFAVFGAVVGAAWTLLTGTLNKMGDFPGQEMSPAAAFMQMVLAGPSDPGLIAFFGWLDTSAPGIVYVAYGFAALSLLVSALAISDKRWRVVVISSAAVFLFAPALLQAASVGTSGYIWQGRYSLVVYVAMLLVCGIALVLSASRLSAVRNLPSKGARNYLCLTLLVLLIAQAWAFVSNLRRYAVSEVGSVPNIYLAPEWSPEIWGTAGVTVMLLMGLGVLSVLTWHAAREVSVHPLNFVLSGSKLQTERV